MTLLILLLAEALAKFALLALGLSSLEGMSSHFKGRIILTFPLICSCSVIAAPLAADTSICGTLRNPSTYNYMLDWYVYPFDTKSSCSSSDRSFVFQRSLSLAYGVLLLGLALSKSPRFWMPKKQGGSRLVYVLVKDQILYFCL